MTKVNIENTLHEVVQKAERWAEIYHENHWYGDYPYTKHLFDVGNVLLEFGFDSVEMLAAGWLHDILEDTEVPLKLLLHEFGNEIFELVWAVTDGIADTRAKRKAIAYQKIQLLPMASILKLADRIANVRACVNERNHKLYQMYRREMKEFEKQMPRLLIAEPMWQELELLFAPGQIV